MRIENGIIHFYKVSGAGNHFVLLDLRNDRLPMRRRDLAKALCMQGHSIGADGVLFLEKSSTADFRLLYYNADGGEAPMCGNGARCAAAYAFEKGIVGTNMIFETPCALIEANATRGSVELNMGSPRDFREKVVIRTSTGKVEGSLVNTGVPHFVTVVREVRKLPVETLGRELRFHRRFRPGGVNVDFVQINRDRSLIVRTYERGVEAETLACGTGAVAAAVCLGVKGLVRPPVRIQTRGGDTLIVKYVDESNPLSSQLLKGSAQVIFEGRVRVSVLRGIRERFKLGE